MTEIDDFIGKAVDAELKDLAWSSAQGAFEPIQMRDGTGLAGYSALEINTARVLSENEGDWSFEDDFTD